MPIKQLTLLIVCLNSYSILAQSDTSTTLTNVQSRHEIEDNKVHTPQVKMSGELSKFVSMMDSLDAKTLVPEGYRIQIFSAAGPNGKKDAITNQSDFLKTFEKTTSYTLWNYPGWVVRVGDYRTYLAALEFHMEIRELYPASFIVTDEIKVDYSSK